MLGYYYGCIKTVGHRMHTVKLQQIYGWRSPWGVYPDGTLAPHTSKRCGNGCSTCACTQPEGVSAVHHKDGWTALAFWDRSIDRRTNSNSVFLFSGDHDFLRMIALAIEHFPSVMKRFEFPITEHVIRVRVPITEKKD